MSREAVATTVIKSIESELGQGRVARAVDVVYSELDEMGIVDMCDVMRLVVASKLPLSTALSALTISLPWRIATGAARQELVQYALSKATEKLGEEEGAAVLRGLV